MQRLLLLGCVWLVSCICASAEVVTNGLSISVASNAMQKAGYTKTGLEMFPLPGEDLQFWQVGQEVLIVGYSKTSQKIVGLTFWFADERPKASRRTFEFEVASFDTSSGMMTIRTTKGEAKRAANGSKPTTVHPLDGKSVVLEGRWNGLAKEQGQIICSTEPRIVDVIDIGQLPTPKHQQMVRVTVPLHWRGIDPNERRLAQRQQVPVQLFPDGYIIRWSEARWEVIPGNL